MNYLPRENDYKQIIWVLGINNLLRGICQGIVIPGILWSITEVIV